MDEERIEMSQKERDRLHWLKLARDREITPRQAAERMGVSARWVRKLLRRLRRKGDRAVVHGRRHRPSNRRIAEAVRERAIALVRAEYRDFGPTLAAEYLRENYALAVSKETLRKWMIEAQLWRAQRARIGEVHGWRPRRECFGELVQWDTSEHEWLEGRGPKLYLIGMMDDATSRALGRFVEHDSTAENMRLLWRWLERFGRPLEYYTDKAGLFQVNRPLHYNKHLEEAPPLTQIGRALKELGIGWIGAHSAPAKGRIERFFGTAQDRLVKGLRKAGASTLEAANQYLERVYLPLWNQRFTVESANGSDAHRRLLAEPQLAAILSHVEERVITNDHTFQFGAQRYQIQKSSLAPRMRGRRLRVEVRLDGTLAAR
jgi:transposase